MGSEGTYQLQKLSHVHHAMVDLALGGRTNKEIAELMGRTPESVGLIVKSPQFQHELARRRQERRGQSDGEFSTALAEAERKMAGLLGTAVDTHGELMAPGIDPRIRQTSATEILRLAYGRQTSGKGSVVVQINADQLQNLQIALQEDGGGSLPSEEAA